MFVYVACMYIVHICILGYKYTMQVGRRDSCIIHDAGVGLKVPLYKFYFQYEHILLVKA